VASSLNKARRTPFPTLPKTLAVIPRCAIVCSLARACQPLGLTATSWCGKADVCRCATKGSNCDETFAPAANAKCPTVSKLGPCAPLASALHAATTGSSIKGRCRTPRPPAVLTLLVLDEALVVGSAGGASAAGAHGLKNLKRMAVSRPRECAKAPVGSRESGSCHSGPMHDESACASSCLAELL